MIQYLLLVYIVCSFIPALMIADKLGDNDPWCPPPIAAKLFKAFWILSMAVAGYLLARVKE